MKTRRFPVHSPLAPLFIPLLASASLVKAADQSWGTNANTAWLTNSNWTGGAYPGAIGNSGNTDIATVSAGTGTTLQINMNTAGGNFSLGALDYGRTIGSTLHNNTTALAGILRLNGATVGGVANTLIRINSTGTTTLTVSGNTTGTLGLALGNTAGVFDTASGRTLNITAPITEISAGSGYTKTGAGVMSLAPVTGSNAASGVISLAAGTLTATPNGIGSASKIVLNSTGSGAGLVFNNALTATQMGTIPGIFNTPIEVNGDVTLGIGATGGPLIHDGTLTLTGAANSTRVLTLTRDLVQRAAISDGGSNITLVKDGSNNLRLTTANTFTGGFVFQGTGAASNAGNNMVWIGDDNAFGTGKVTIASGATRLSSDSATARTIANAVDFGDDILLGRFNASAAVNVAAATAGYSTLIVPAGTPTGKLTFTGDLGDVTITGGDRILTAEAEFEISAGIKEDVPGRAFTKAGAALVTLSGANTYTGLTTVSAGELNLSGSLAGGASVSAGAKLSGTGTITGAVTAATGATVSGTLTLTGGLTTTGATVEPGGAAIGTISTGALSLDSASIVTLTINDDTAGNLDRISNSGLFSANSAALNVTFTDTTFTQATSSADLPSATRYTFVTGAVDSTVFGNATAMNATDIGFLGLTGPQYEFTFSGQRFLLEKGSFSLVPIAPVLVPEPSAAAALGLGAIALAGRRRRRA